MSYANLVGVQFKRAGRVYHFALREQMSVLVGDMVVVDTDRGLSLAKVVKLVYHDNVEEKKGAAKKVIRKATPNDLKEGRIKADEMQGYVQEKIKKLSLNMQILKVEVHFSGNKVLVYFSAPGRVDFRKLVKELASDLHLRVELKQVGPRNETKLLGGVGVCGREYCCSSFLREFLPVSTKMAKNQNLAINPTKLSGGCGRLLCCLRYENDNYTELRKKLPERGEKVLLKETNTQVTVVKVDLLNEILLIESEEGSRTSVKASKTEVISKPDSTSPSSTEDAEADWGEDLDLEDLLE